LAWGFTVVAAVVVVASPVLSPHRRLEAIGVVLFVAFVRLVIYCHQPDSEGS
jgi:hypothetical protein